MGIGPQQGDRELNRQWRPALMSFFLRRVRNHAEAEDLTQEVLARIVAGSDTEVQAPDAYIFQTAANLLRDRARRSKVRADYLEKLSAADLQDIEVLDPYRVATGREALAALMAGLDELPERTRSIFTLYKIENLDQAAIADAYGISRSAVKKQVMKAMAHLMTRVRDKQ